jgi:Protein of unknown function (DUF1570)
MTKESRITKLEVLDIREFFRDSDFVILGKLAACPTESAVRKNGPVQLKCRTGRNGPARAQDPPKGKHIRHSLRHRALVLAAIGCALAASQSPARSAAGQAANHVSERRLHQLQEELAAAQKRHGARLDALSQGFSDLGLSDDAEHCRALARPMATGLFRVQKPPRDVQPEIPASLSDKERDLRVSLRKTEQEYAADVYQLSRKALRAGFSSYAFQLIQEVVRQDPDHAAARRILGYKKRGKEWVTPFANEMLDKGFVWDDTFGWQKKIDLPRYKAGKRFYAGRWMTAAQEAEIRRDFRHAWRVRTDHFLVTTNHSLERGVEVAKELEQYHEFFMQTFAAFFSTPDQINKLFLNPGGLTGLQSRARPYQVDYFRSRDEYVRRLESKIPQIGITNGLYYTADHKAYFYYNPANPNPDTLYHEATHQLFYENFKGDRMIAMDANFWIVEGIACYMESYHNENGQSVVGDPRHPRIRAARHQCLVEKYYIPLEQFAAMGTQEFQSPVEIVKRYSQAAGLAHFFMHYDNGRYRDALVKHLYEIYAAGSRQRGGVQSLPELTGVSYSELDRQYVEYMQSLFDGITEASAVGR